MENQSSEKISNLKVVPLKESMYLKPLRAEFTVNGIPKFWDFLKVHDSVSILIYNTTRNVVVLVRQFRPSMYIGQVGDVNVGDEINTQTHPIENGYSLELCAGIVDKEKPVEEIAKEEVLEECGYNVPVESLQKIFSFRSVGVSGTQQTQFYVEVTDGQKVSDGGGLREEGEFIQVVELTVPELQEYIDKKYIPSPPGFVVAAQWFLYNLLNKRKI